MKAFQLSAVALTKYLFFTGKGGVGKTSVACATAVELADSGKKVLLISTDPASNLQDVFKTEINGKGTKVGVENLTVVNVNPIEAAAEYRESVIAPYRGIMPPDVIQNMEEQLSGSCTVEIAAFNEFTRFLADDSIESEYDHIIFDTAPTGHTLRMLQLPSAWTNFIAESTHGASCLGQLSGLQAQKESYRKAVDTRADGEESLLVLVTRPEIAPLKEAERASGELRALGVNHQILIVNGYLMEADDEISEKLKAKQKAALDGFDGTLKAVDTFFIPLRSYNVIGLANIRSLLNGDRARAENVNALKVPPKSVKEIVEDILLTGKRVVFTMGKGGVGKTTFAAAIAVGLAERGKNVYLATTDHAHHIQNALSAHKHITTGYIDEKAELKKYQEEVLTKARATMSENDIAYVEEDLRSPCTQEIAVFRAFAEIVEKADDEIVVIDTAPSGHTLLLLDSTQSYHKEVERTQGGNIPESVKRLLPRLRDEKQTAVIIVSLAEATPVYEALRLEEDLRRAQIPVRFWAINSSFYKAKPAGKLLKSKAAAEVEWINTVGTHTGGNYVLIPWFADEMKDIRLNAILEN